jgi:3-methyl-2-oxobutanoate hydroxymethyltransferase
MNGPRAAATSPTTATERVTTSTLQRLKRSATPITMLTAYDYPTALRLDAAGVDCLLVGDSLAMVVQGHATTLPVTLDQMIYHAEMVGRAAQRAMVIVDLPFPEGQLGIERSIAAAARVLKETRAHAVKLEGGSDQAQRIAAMVDAGIPVMAHIGLQPQHVHVDGGYRVKRDAAALLQQSLAAQQAGAFAVLIECVPADIATSITEQLQVPTIGIGAGNGVDGQVLVTHDLLGLTSGYSPKFVKPQASLGEAIEQAVQRYCDEVRQRTFPDAAHSFRK